MGKGCVGGATASFFRGAPPEAFEHLAARLVPDMWAPGTWTPMSSRRLCLVRVDVEGAVDK